MFKVKEFYYRKKKLSKNFFENVSFYGKCVEKHILAWIYYLYRYKDTSINRFSDLFVKYEDIVFPITVFSRGRVSLGIIDSKDNEYYFEYSTEYSEMNEYHIGRRKYPCDIGKTFEIAKNGKISLKEMGVIQLKKDGNNKEEIFSINYDHNSKVTTATIQRKNETLEIMYAMQNEEFDDKILEYLFEVNSKDDYFNDVFPILSRIEGIEKVDSLSIKAISNSETLSEIVLENRIVTKYSFLERINNSEICLHRIIISEDVDTFIAEH